MDITYIVAVLLLTVLFSLPDMLRRRRRYKTGPRRKETPETMEHKPTKQPVATRYEEEVPKQGQGDGGLTQTQRAWLNALEKEEIRADRAKASFFERPKEDETKDGWNELDGVARDIYAGIVWSELLQKPKSLRRK